MAERRDYLLRMIEQMGAVFARLRQLILGGEVAQEEMRSAASRAGVDLTTAKVLDADSLLVLLLPEGQVDPTRTWLTAELIGLDALAADRQGRIEEALEGYRKALRLYLALDPRIIGGIPEAANRMAELEARITALSDTSPSAA
jgi:hypothetical protein